MQQEASRLPKHPINTIHTGKERKGRKTECSSLHKAVFWAKGWYLSASSQPTSFPWSIFPGSITAYAICLGWEEQSENPREANVAQKKAKLLCKSKSSCGELCFESWAEGQGRPPQILSRWIHSQAEEARMPFLVSLHRNSAGQHPQANFTGHDAFILYKTCECLLWAFSSLYPEGIQTTAAQRLCIFTLVLSCFHLPPPTSQSYLRL